MTLAPERKQAVEKAGDEPVRVEGPEAIPRTWSPARKSHAGSAAVLRPLLAIADTERGVGLRP